MKIFFTLFLSLFLMPPAIAFSGQGRDIPRIEITSGKTTALELKKYFPLMSPEKATLSGPAEKMLEWSFNDKTAVMEMSFRQTGGSSPEKGTIPVPLTEELREGIFSFRTGIDTVTFSLPVAFRQNRGIKLQYADSNPSLKVSCAGEFNGWNPSAAIMEYDTLTGRYSVTLDLSAGTYMYKFVVDGKWIMDPANPESVPDGFGGANSILKAGEASKPVKMYPVRRETKKNKTSYKFHYSSADDETPSFLVFFNNKPHQDFSYDKKTKMLSVTTDDKPENEQIISINIKDSSGVVPQEFRFRDGDRKEGFGDIILYFAFTDRFSDGNPENNKPVKDPELSEIANYRGGDFAGIRKKLREGYFDLLNINAVWISPVITNPSVALPDSLPPHRKFTGYHGYWPLDDKKVEARFGTPRELRELSDEAAKKNIRLVADIVANHTYIESTAYKNNPSNFTPLLLADGRKNIRLFDEYPLSTWFDDFLPSYDFEKSKASRSAVIENTVYWIKEYGFTGLRLDAVKHIPDIFWKELRYRLLSLYPEKAIFSVGETISSREYIARYISPDMMDSQFDFPLYWAIRDIFALRKRGFTDLDREWDMSRKIFGEKLSSNFIGNHDYPRFMAYADGDLPDGVNDKELGFSSAPVVNNPENYAKLRMAMSFIMTIPGIPLIYYGDEFGLSGAGDPDNRRMMRFGEELSAEEKENLEWTAKMTAFRKKHPATRYGEKITLAVSENEYAYAMTYFGDTAICLFNSGTEEKEISFNIPSFIGKEYKDYITGRKYKADAKGSMKVTLPPITAMLLE